MKTHTFGNQTFAVFQKTEQGPTRTVQFIWGKKDFRIHVGPAGAVALGHARLQGPAGDLVVTGLQYLYNFEWYDFVQVADHGLALEKLMFRRADRGARYVELPKDLVDIAVEIACREFGLKRTDPHAKAG